MRQLVILLAALCVAATLFVYCTSVEFDNPLDRKSRDTFLDGDTTREREKISGDTAAFFTNPELRCLKTAPRLTMQGSGAVTIERRELAEFVKWMGLGPLGWEGVLQTTELPGAINIRPAYLTLGFGGTGQEVPHSTSATPDTGRYTIVYKALRPACGADATLSDSTVLHRNLTVEENRIIDNLPPIIELLRGPSVSTDLGQRYADPGFNMTNSDGQTPARFVSITYTATGVSPEIITSIADTARLFGLIETNRENSTFTLRYCAESTVNMMQACTTRTVTVRSGDVTGHTPVIVLNMYRHPIGSHIISHPDTTFRSGDIYVEKDARAFVLRGVGDTVWIPADRIVRGTLPSFTSPSPTRRQVTYSLPSGEFQGVTYREAAQVNRSVYITVYCDPEDGPLDPPVVNLLGGNPLALPAGPWNVNQSWSVTANDQRAPWNAPYLVDFGTMLGQNDSRSGATVNPRPGSHTVIYVGLSGCGIFSSPAVRTVTAP
jgi:hypothetical protein